MNRDSRNKKKREEKNDPRDISNKKRENTERKE
jgi:hypothetical protein